jgi:hypothetical protein
VSRFIRRRWAPIIVIVAALAAVLLTPALWASAGSSTVSAAEDSYTSQSNASATHGADTSLSVNAKSANKNDERRIYVKFNVTQIPAGATGVGVTLQLYSQQSTSTGVFTANQVASTWTEAALTWNNQPAKGAAISSKTGLANGYNSWDVSSYVTGNGTWSVVLTSSATTQRFFNSKENSGGNPPQLALSWTDPTTTTTTTTTTTSTTTTTTSTTTTTTTLPPPQDLLTRTDLIKATEIGEWQVPNGGSPTVDQPIAQETVDAAATVVRVAVADCFTGTTCGSDNHAGTVSRASFDTTIQRIRDNIHPVAIWFKLLPTSHDYPSTATATSFCPPWTGPANQSQAMYQDQVNEIHAAGWTGGLILELSNEMYFDCTSGTAGPWDVQSGTNLGGGSVGVSKRVGEHYAANAPALKTYAQGLGFSQVVVGDDIGVPGGAQWGQSFVPDVNGPYGYTWTYQNRWVDEFNNAVLAGAAAAPDFEAWHAYPHSPDNYAAAPYESTLGDPASAVDDDQIIYSYFRGQITRYRQRVDAIWGSTFGDQVRFAISEGSPGANNTGGTWAGWTTAGRPEQFLGGWLDMLKGDGGLTGTGTRYWEFTLFCDACNGDTGAGHFYDIIHQDGTLPSWYTTWKNFTP